MVGGRGRGRVNDGQRRRGQVCVSVLHAKASLPSISLGGATAVALSSHPAAVAVFSALSLPPLGIHAVPTNTAEVSTR